MELIQLKRGAAEAGIEEDIDEPTRRKMENEPGSSSGANSQRMEGTVAPHVAGEVDPRKTNSEDVAMENARGAKRSAEGLDGMRWFRQYAKDGPT